MIIKLGKPFKPYLTLPSCLTRPHQYNICYTLIEIFSINVSSSTVMATDPLSLIYILYGNDYKTRQTKQTLPNLT